jgi:hypothetical protein
MGDVDPVPSVHRRRVAAQAYPAVGFPATPGSPQARHPRRRRCRSGTSSRWPKCFNCELPPVPRSRESFGSNGLGVPAQGTWRCQGPRRPAHASLGGPTLAPDAPVRARPAPPAAPPPSPPPPPGISPAQSRWATTSPRQPAAPSGTRCS